MAHNIVVAAVALLVLLTVLAPYAAPLTLPMLAFVLLVALANRRYEQAEAEAWEQVETKAEAVTHTATWGCGGLAGALAAAALGLLLLASLLQTGITP